MTAINTLQVRLSEEPDQPLEQQMREYVADFSGKSGCLRYEITRSDAEPCLWIISGHWSDAAQMTEHFESDAMKALVNLLIQARAHLVFGSAVQHPVD